LKLQITINGKVYEVDVEVLEDEGPEESSGPAPSRSAGSSAGNSRAQAGGGNWDADGKVCHSPLMGLVIKINVTPGQAVQAGDPLMVLEAMKMETNVTAPRAGIVKSVSVAAGDPVKVNQVLAELE
jgi:biotin carboxyl carrier protein